MEQKTVSRLTQSIHSSENQEIEATLLAGQFDSALAKRHVLGIFGKSIEHYWIQSFKQHELFSESDEYSDKMIAELSKIREDFLLIMEQAENDGLTLDIEASLKLSVSSAEQTDKTAY